jgi:shikimate kinase / 3-dehydroquinate synthase
MKNGVLDMSQMVLDPSITKNLVLTGFMGTGKSSLGAHLGELWGRPFVDMDELIQERFQLTIAEIFAQKGELAFRAEERLICEELGVKQSHIIATGGGALVAAENLKAIGAGSYVVNLKASPKSIFERVQGDHQRPLLAETTDLMATIQGLMGQREKAYQRIPLQLSTDGKDYQSLAAEVATLITKTEALPRHKTLQVPTPTNNYPIVIGSGLSRCLETLLAQRDLTGRRIALISNPEILRLHGAGVQASLERASGSELVVIAVPEGEQHKTLDTIQTLYDGFLDAGMDRTCLVVALGGGVVGDMAGFAAATYLRGVRFIQIPSTLLAMVDSSVGGKTGVDVAQGKNLVGAFKQPELVVVDPDLLKTLPVEEFRSGLAEVIKHAVLADSELFSILEKNAQSIDLESLSRAIQVKVDVVSEDPLEQGRRAILNLGHTFGHAFEQVSGFGIRHGEAVAVGMLCAVQMGLDLGICDSNLETRLRALLIKAGLPIAFTGYKNADLLGAMVHDKKRKRGRMRFIVPRSLGKVDIVTEPNLEIIERAFAAGIAGE